MPQTNPVPSGASHSPVHPAAPNRDRASVNDLHSRLNPTRVRRIERPDSVQALRRLLRRTDADGVPVCIAGGRHAMGGQQFASGAVLIDMTAMDRVLAFDAHKGHIDVEAGICWPELLAWLARVQKDRWPQWGIRQKQTGADRISIGGTLSANAHGRGLNMKPFVDDVESFTLLGADGRIRTCSRDRNSELFTLAIGGYGLFGIIVTVRFIEQDGESFLPWARAPYACIIFNLHTAHTRAALEKTAADFRGLIDRAIRHGGGYYLTYHRWASRRQVQSCYPEFARFLELKMQYDPGECFQSDWYRYYKSMFADVLESVEDTGPGK